MALMMGSRIGVGRLALQPLLEMYLRVALLLIASSELSAALITAKRFFASVRAHVGG